MTRSRLTALSLMGASVLLTLLAGCGSGDADVAGGSPPRATATPTGSPSPTPALPGNTEPAFADQRGEWDLVLVDVRAAERDDFQRIVLEFAGTGVPGWAVDYVDEAAKEGSGEVVSLDGDSILQIFASGTTYPNEGETPHSVGPVRLEPGGSGTVADVHVVGTWEGYTQVFVGTDGSPAPFRVFALTEPSRLVVDIGRG